MSDSLFCVIMAGGRGTRFWPASRKARPKQFLSFFGGGSMIARTRERVRDLVPDERVLVVTGVDQVELVRESLPGLPPENVLAEPVGRNTAACCAWAALETRRRDPDSTQLVLAADHVIESPERFVASCRTAVEAARDGALVTLGIRPTEPSEAYGYIETGEELATVAGEPVMRVARFVEKPRTEVAREFLAAGNFLWNAGIFVWRSASILAAFEKHAPDVLAPLAAAGDVAATQAVYPELPAHPVDKAILERSDRVVCLPIDYGWSDVGSWTALPDVIAADERGNVLGGDTRLVGVDASDCIVYGEGGETIALIGVEGLVVVRSGDATLVVPRERAQEVRRIVDALERDDPSLL